jgi:hypothetical protein
MAVDSVHASATSQVTGAIRQAAHSSGISFEYLLTTAQIESNLNPAAQASTSSAKGLYQFIEQTWLGTMKQDGAATGYGHYADAITRSPDGRYEVADPSMRTAIMRLRSDPTASATLAGAFTRNNAEQLRSAIGRPPSDGELYIAHFLGPYGAGKLIGAAMAQPQANAAAMFPQAAAANPSIFLDHSGRPRSAADVYANLTGRFDVARAARFAPNQSIADRTRVGPAAHLVPPALLPAARIAQSALPAPIPPTRTAQAAPVVSPAPLPSPDTAGVTQAFAATQERALPQPPNGRPLFQTMFADRTQPLPQTVTSLWTPASTEVQSASGSAQPLNLFTDIRPGTRRLIGGSS